MDKDKFGVIIIAAGYSSRMNDFKPLMDLNGSTPLQRLIRTYHAAGLRNIYIVVGHRREEIIKSLKGEKVEILVNESFDQGMLSSVKKGIQSFDGHLEAFFLHPADIPLVNVSTINQLAEAYSTFGKGIVYPTCSQKKGHPPLISCKYANSILTMESNSGLKGILQQYEEDSMRLPVSDKAVLMDMDTREDYEELRAFDKSLRVNTREI